MKIYFTIFLVLLLSCKKSDSINNCSTPITIATSATASMPCSGTSTITINQPNGDYTYKIDNGSFQANAMFNNVTAGKHVLTVKDATNCEQKKEVIIDTVAAGILFKTVQLLLVTKCTPCHVGFSPQASIDMNNICDIVTYWDRIKARAVDGNPSPMPQAGLLPISDRNKIMDWINAGHTFTN